VSCAQYNNQLLQLFTSSLFIAGLLAGLVATVPTRHLGRRVTMLVHITLSRPPCSACTGPSVGCGLPSEKASIGSCLLMVFFLSVPAIVMTKTDFASPATYQVVYLGTPAACQAVIFGTTPAHACVLALASQQCCLHRHCKQ